MIRYHKTNSTVPDTYLVSARRVPRGYVFKKVRWEKVYCYPTRYEASFDYVKVEGWGAMGLNGYQPEYIFRTRKAAANHLLSDHRFRMEKPWRS